MKKEIMVYVVLLVSILASVYFEYSKIKHSIQEQSTNPMSNYFDIKATELEKFIDLKLSNSNQKSPQKVLLSLSINIKNSKVQINIANAWVDDLSTEISLPFTIVNNLGYRLNLYNDLHYCACSELLKSENPSTFISVIG